MKLIFAVIRDKDAGEALKGLVRKGIGVTKLSSTGGFLRDGNTTLMIGAPDEQVDAVMEVLGETCAQRTEVEVLASQGTGGMPMWNVGTAPLKVTVGGATVFVLDVTDFRKL